MNEYVFVPETQEKPPSDPAPDEDELRLARALSDGDEAAFAELIDRHGAAMLRIARMLVRDAAVAEDVVQETWIAVMRGADKFEGRSSFRTWLFRVLSNRAKTR